MSPSNTNLIAFRVYNRLAQELRRRGEPEADRIALSQVAQRDLERYYVALTWELRQVALSENEALLIVDALNGILTDPAEGARLLWAEVSDAIQMDGLASKWDVDGGALIDKLRSLTFTQSLAVIDAAARWWDLIGTMSDRAEALRQVGLLPTAKPSVEYKT